MWLDSPTSGSRSGEVIKIPDLGVQFEVPDTLYVFKSCSEAAHSPASGTGWIPIVTCRSTSGDAFDGGEAGEEDPFAAEEREAASGAEAIEMTIYVTEKTRPLDERAVTWFENQYKQAGLGVEEVAYQSDYQKKAGIYAKLQIMNGNTPTREIVRFMFPLKDVVFIAETEYPFGDSRAIEKDWMYILWNFDWLQPTAEGEGEGEAAAG